MQIDVECVGFAPDFIRPIPQQLEIQSDEIQWINPSIMPDVIWDYNICTDNNMLVLVKELMQKAYKI